MCLARVCFEKEPNIKSSLEDIAYIECKGKELVLETLFGKKQSITAKIKKIDFANSTVIIEKRLPEGSYNEDINMR